MEGETRLLLADLEACCKGRLPKQLKHLYPALVAFSLGGLSWLTTFFAFQEGMLYKPVDGPDGEFLTLMYVIRN